MGVGHVPQEPVRAEGEDPLLQRREHRGTSARRNLTTPVVRNNARVARGAWGEDLAEAWYRRNGWTIVGRNVRHGRGEIDLIAEKNGVVAVVEVKTRRSSDFGSPAQAMTPHKQRTVRGTAFRWAADNGVATRRLRFDLVCIEGTSIDVQFDVF